MRKLLFLFFLFIFLFALQANSSASKDAADSIRLHSGLMLTTQFSGTASDVVSDNDGKISYCIEMLEASEGDIDKIILPATSSYLPQSACISPESNTSDYRFLTDFWLDKPPQLTAITI